MVPQYDRGVTITWREAEVLAAAHMRELGFTDARPTGPGVDAGIDVIATGAVAQVKHLTAPVGAPDVQRFRGAAFSVRRALFYSSSGYTTAALAAAERTDIALFTIRPDLTIAPINAHAHGVLPPPPPTESERLHEDLMQSIYPQRLRGRAWSRVARRRTDGDDYRGKGADPEPEKLLLAAMCGDRADVALVATTIHDLALAVGMGFIEIVRLIDADKSADSYDTILELSPNLRHDPTFAPTRHPDLSVVPAEVARLTGELDELEEWLLDHIGDVPALVRMARAEASVWATEYLDDWGPISPTVVFPRR